MAEYHVGCGLTGIYAGTLKPKKKDEWLNKSLVTDEAIDAVRDYLFMNMKSGDKTNGYSWKLKDGRTVELVVNVHPSEENELKDGKIEEQTTIEPEPQWIPFKTRRLTEEEQDEHPEWNCVLDCKLPDDGQTILVSINLRGHERVQYDEFYTDDGSYLDSGYAIGEEATAWMPLPEPYKEGEQE